MMKSNYMEKTLREYIVIGLYIIYFQEFLSITFSFIHLWIGEVIFDFGSP